jgi:hypothetical protein
MDSERDERSPKTQFRASRCFERTKITSTFASAASSWPTVTTRAQKIAIKILETLMLDVCESGFCWRRGEGKCNRWRISDAKGSDLTETSRETGRSGRIGSVFRRVPGGALDHLSKERFGSDMRTLLCYYLALGNSMRFNPGITAVFVADSRTVVSFVMGCRSTSSVEA